MFLPRLSGESYEVEECYRGHHYLRRHGCYAHHECRRILAKPLLPPSCVCWDASLLARGALPLVAWPQTLLVATSFSRVRLARWKMSAFTP